MKEAAPWPGLLAGSHRIAAAAAGRSPGSGHNLAKVNPESTKLLVPAQVLIFKYKLRIKSYF